MRSRARPGSTSASPGRKARSPIRRSTSCRRARGTTPYTGTACRKVYARVRDGATLLVSKGNQTTLAGLAEVSGNEVDWTSADGETATVTLDGFAGRPLRVQSATTVRILPKRSRVLATDAARNAYLTVCDYGKGKVVYVNSAIERDSFLQGGAYFGANLNPLYLVYRTATQLAGVRRVVEKSAACPNVGLAEHPDGAGRVIVVAINYDPEPVICPIRIAGRVEQVFKGSVADGKIALAANDVAIFAVCPSASATGEMVVSAPRFRSCRNPTANSARPLRPPCPAVVL